MIESITANIAEELFVGENKKSVVELISKNYNDAEKLAIFMAIYEQVDGRRDAMDSFIRECKLFKRLTKNKTKTFSICRREILV